MLSVSPSVRADILGGQHPAVFWIGCSDSRVPPELIAGAEPGELFVLRNIGNAAPPEDPSAMAALSYAVETLGVSDIVVCGHSDCGAIKAALSLPAAGPMETWIAGLRAGLGDVSAFLEGASDPVRAAAERNVRTQVSRLAATPSVRARWAAGAVLRLRGWFYDLVDGRLIELFPPLTAPTLPQGLAVTVT